MTHIRPHRIFDLLPEPVSERIVQIKIPHRTECWLLETFLLISAMRIVKAKRIFEFGTFRGATTLNLALNAPLGGDIFTFDLLAEDSVEQDALHAEITRQHFAQEKMEFEQFPTAATVHRVGGNSLEFDFSEYYRSMDLVFVDGGHDRRTIAADTSNALKMAPHGCVVWHDYGNPDYPDVKQYLDAFSIPLFHVEDSRMVFWFGDQDIAAKVTPLAHWTNEQ